ncbi:glutathione S-transferase [Macrophomina phaseolina]|uniref:Glutathione S-transferase n=1 Tax=Macrophomina phaseolina TaxID=35725 RepID=A0ABQ8FTA0_9PEZI|nr:glutathione S-transferase [Macrophomina phaseolina]
MTVRCQKDTFSNFFQRKDGELQRPASVFRNWISSEPGAEFPPEKGRYHLYVSYACPWAHRTLIVRHLKGLADVIPYTSVHWHLDMEKGIGWRFAWKDEAVTGENVGPDPVHPEYQHISELYHSVDPDYRGRFTVPVLYDKKTHRIVSNESSEIIRMFYSEFDGLLPEKFRAIDLFPEALRSSIEETNEWTYDNINNGVYKSGIATKQEAYDKAVKQVFAALDRVEAQLSSTGPYYFGDSITEADIRLYPTIIRFDVVYVQHFKCNLRDIRSGYPAIHAWLRRLYWDVPAFGETTEFEHIKKHYTKSHLPINPYGITPLGPEPPILAKDSEVPAVQAARL